MKKLLASDLDGTLVFKNEITLENKNAVKKLNREKEIFIVSTGRPFNGVEFLDKEFSIKIDYYVLLNGALILNKEKEIIKHEFIERKVVEEIMDKHLKKDMKISVETGFVTYLLTEGDQLPYPNLIKVDGLKEVQEDISLISVYCEGYDIEDIEKIKNEINGNNETIIAYRNSDYIDIVSKGCSKGNGVKFVANEKKILKENIYTIGDSWNDVTMFNITENSFTFHEVEEELKENANYLVESVAQCINEYVLI